MCVILSRKGFDSSNGGIPSPILPDGTLLFFPIPSNDAETYDDLFYNGISYAEILSTLAPGKPFTHCHVDPDLRQRSVPGWLPAFGQTGAAQGLLRKAGVGIGDIFLFFGWFRQVDGQFHYVKGAPDLHVIYGYLEVGSILTGEEIELYPWHPHAHRWEKNNTLYVPSERLSMNPDLPGYGTLDYREDRVLTMDGSPRATWKPHPFLMPEHIYGNRKNSAKECGLYYSGIWQELVVEESERLLEWVRRMVQL